MVARSYDDRTTKSKKERIIPIADALVQYLDAAIDASPSEYVFPTPDGEMMAENTKVEVILRRALGRPDVVTGPRSGPHHSDAHPGAQRPNITAKVYAHLVPGFLETAVNRLPIGKRATPNTAVGAHAAHRFGSPWSATRSRRQKAKARPRENLLREPGLWFGCGGLQLVVAYDSGDVRASGRLEPGLQILLLSRDFTNRADRGENPSPV